MMNKGPNRIRARNEIDSISGNAVEIFSAAGYIFPRYSIISEYARGLIAFFLSFRLREAP